MLNESKENVDFLDTPSQESPDGPEASVEVPTAEPTPVVEPEVPEQTPQPELAPVAPQFDHPHLKGKTQAEIESLFNLMQNTVQSQTHRINELASLPAAQPDISPPAEPKGDFFEDPLAHMRREMQAAVAPINEEISNLKAQSLVNLAWEQASMKFQDFDKYRPHVEVMIQNMGVAPTGVTPDLLESLYYGAKGYIATHEATMTQPQAPTATPQAPPPPQHRPSAAPLPRSVGAKPRELTEDERRMAREFGMTHEQWIEWGEKDEEAVANAEEVAK